MHNDELFERSGRKAIHSNEEWGENEHGYFSFESGTFIPKKDAKESHDPFGGFSGPPFGVEVSPSWPGEVGEKKEE